MASKELNARIRPTMGSHWLHDVMDYHILNAHHKMKLTAVTQNSALHVARDRNVLLNTRGLAQPPCAYAISIYFFLNTVGSQFAERISARRLIPFFVAVTSGRALAAPLHLPSQRVDQCDNLLNLDERRTFSQPEPASRQVECLSTFRGPMTLLPMPLSILRGLGTSNLRIPCFPTKLAQQR
jgi:hypothetical protein